MASNEADTKMACATEPQPTAPVDCMEQADMTRFVKELRAWGGGELDALYYRNIVQQVAESATPCGDTNDKIYIIDANAFIRAVHVAVVILSNEIDVLPDYYNDLRDYIVDRAHDCVLGRAPQMKSHGSVQVLLELVRTVILQFVWKNVSTAASVSNDDPQVAINHGLQCIDFEAVGARLHKELNRFRTWNASTGGWTYTYDRDKLVMTLRECFTLGLRRSPLAPCNVRGAIKLVISALMMPLDYESMFLRDESKAFEWKRRDVVVDNSANEHFEKVMTYYAEYCKKITPPPCASSETQ